MSRSTNDNATRPASPVPRGGWLAMGSVLGAMALLSIYSNLQKARRGEIEKVTITRASPSPVPSPAP